ncbi:hypothetical protein BC629DRAFT_1439925 [Irpex lacteus]|nr:hypothetical protein BC629DRAFT_1439925 [Irpex lacteus]
MLSESEFAKWEGEEGEGRAVALLAGFQGQRYRHFHISSPDDLASSKDTQEIASHRTPLLMRDDSPGQYPAQLAEYFECAPRISALRQQRSMPLGVHSITFLDPCSQLQVNANGHRTDPSPCKPSSSPEDEMHVRVKAAHRPYSPSQKRIEPSWVVLSNEIEFRSKMSTRNENRKEGRLGIVGRAKIRSGSLDSSPVWAKMKMKKTMVPREIADVMYPHLANQAAQGFESKGKTDGQNGIKIANNNCKIVDVISTCSGWEASYEGKPANQKGGGGESDILTEAAEQQRDREGANE